MGQFLDYLATMFNPNRVESRARANRENGEQSSHNRSFPQLFSGRGEQDGTAKLNKEITLNNKKTIQNYIGLVVGSIIFQVIMAAIPDYQRLQSYNPFEPQNWQLITLSSIPLVIYFTSIGAMIEINKPLIENPKKNSGLDLNDIDFIKSLKGMICLVSLIQLLSIVHAELLWAFVILVPIWCHKLTNRLAQSESKKYQPSPKKQWAKLNLSKSPKSSPVKVSKSAPVHHDDNAQVRATPRTRTKKAVKNIMTGVSDKYHAFEQNVAHQFSQKMFTPISPRVNMLEN